MKRISVGIEIARNGDCDIYIGVMEKVSQKRDCNIPLDRLSEVFQSILQNPEYDLKEATFWNLTIYSKSEGVRLTNIAFGTPFYRAHLLCIMGEFQGPVSIEGIENYTQLEIFRSDSPIDDLAGIEFCSNLTNIKLIGKASLANLSGLHLTRLDLSEHCVSSDNLEYLQLENLEYLIINIDQVRYLEPEDRYQSLKSLYVEGRFQDPRKIMMKLFGKTDLNVQTEKTSVLLPRLSEKIKRWVWNGPYLNVRFS